MNADETLGQKIHRLRMAKGLSQAQLADRIEITRPHMNVIEHDGVRRPSPDTIDKLESILGPLREHQRHISQIADARPSAAMEEVPFLAVNDLRRGLIEVNLYGVIVKGELHAMPEPEVVLAGEQRAPDAAKSEILVRVCDESLREWNIGPNDYLVVRLCNIGGAATGDVVLAKLNGSHLVKRWMWRDGKRTLESHDGTVFAAIGDGDDLKIIGVLHRSYPLQFHSRPIH